tara:strand:+ start:133 stop:351 length:219 start_codon:yes stop_codon:yes gene_type:complete
MDDKLRIVGQLIGKKSNITCEKIYDAMLMLNDDGLIITIKLLSKTLNCSIRTIHRKMNKQLKKEKTILNEKI